MKLPFFKKSKKSEDGSPLPGNLDLYAHSGRAYARHTIAVLILIILLLLAVILFLVYSNYLTTLELNRKNFAVFTEKCDGSIDTGKVAQFQTSPDAKTVRSLAWNVIRYIKSAGTGNSAVVFDEAGRLMTPDMKQAFSIIADTEQANLKRIASSGQSVYRVIDSANVKPLEKEDLPPGSKTSITQYDAVVQGVSRVLVSDTRQELAREEFMILVRTVPLSARTEANPWGLLVSSMEILDPNKSVRVLTKRQADQQKDSSSGSTVGDMLGLSPDKMRQEQEKIANEANQNRPEK